MAIEIAIATYIYIEELFIVLKENHRKRKWLQTQLFAGRPTNESPIKRFYFGSIQ